MTAVFCIRGAIQAEEDTVAAIDAATRELLEAIVERNRLDVDALVAVWFTQTADLKAEYPAASARRIGWSGVPMLCAQEAAIEEKLPRTIRTLVMASRAPDSGPVHHVYLGAAATLRPDLTPENRGSTTAGGIR